MTGVIGSTVTNDGGGVPGMGAPGTGVVGGGVNPDPAIPVVFTTLFRLNNSGNEIYTAQATGTSSTAQGIIEGLASLPATDTYIECQRPTGGLVSSVMAFDPVGSLQSFGLNDYIVQIAASGLIFRGQNTASLTSTGYTLPEGPGCKARLHRRTTNVVVVETTTDGGQTWTVRFTFPGTSALVLRIHYYTTFATFARIIAQPRQSGLVADILAIKFMADGNSQTVGINGAALSYPGLLATALGKAVTNFGVGGQTTVNMTADAATQIDAVLQNGMNVLIVGEVRNDLTDMGAGADARLAVNHMWTYCAARRAAAIAANKFLKVVLWNILPSARTTNPLGVAGLNAKFDEANALMAAEWSTRVDAYVDVRLVPELLDPNNITYFDDQVHLTPAGDQKLEAVIKTAVLGVLS